MELTAQPSRLSGLQRRPVRVPSGARGRGGAAALRVGRRAGGRAGRADPDAGGLAVDLRGAQRSEVRGSEAGGGDSEDAAKAAWAFLKAARLASRPVTISTGTGQWAVSCRILSSRCATAGRITLSPGNFSLTIATVLAKSPSNLSISLRRLPGSTSRIFSSASTGALSPTEGRSSDAISLKGWPT